MLLRISISVALLLFSVTSFAKDYDFLLPSKETVRSVEEKFSSLKNSSADISDFEKFVDNESFTQVLKKFGSLSSLKENWWLKAYREKQGRRRKVLFYLFSSTVPDRSVRNVLSQVKYLPRGLDFFPVLRGIPSLDYLRKMKTWKEMVGIRVKINPLIFRDVGAKVVPAFVLANCDVISGVLRSKTCVYEKVIYGDVSLRFALEKLLGK